MTSSKREKLIDTALGLFCRDGFHATGIDKILAEAGVSKMTLYKYFKSKDELIIAALRRKDEQYRNWLMQEVERKAKLPYDRILAVFDALDTWFNQETFMGCVFVNAAAEYGDGNNPVHLVSAEHKRLICIYLTDLIRDAGYEEPEGLAEQLLLIIEGAIVSAHVIGERSVANKAKQTAIRLLGCSEAEQKTAANI